MHRSGELRINSDHLAVHPKRKCGHYVAQNGRSATATTALAQHRTISLAVARCRLRGS